jgi:hypothetical protein
MSSVAEKTVNLTDTEEMTVQYCVDGTLQSQLRQTSMLKKGLLLYRQEYEERTESRTLDTGRNLENSVKLFTLMFERYLVRILPFVRHR